MTIRTDKWTWGLAAVVIALTSVRADADAFRRRRRPADARGGHAARGRSGAPARGGVRVKRPQDRHTTRAKPSRCHPAPSSSISRNNHVDEVDSVGRRVESPAQIFRRTIASVARRSFRCMRSGGSAPRSTPHARTLTWRRRRSNQRRRRRSSSRPRASTGCSSRRVKPSACSNGRSQRRRARRGSAARVDAGVLPPNDLLIASATRARYVRLVQARNDRAVVELELGRLVGEPAGVHIVATSPVDRVTSAAAAIVSESPATLIAKALAGRPENAALLARSSSLRSSADAARANVKPYITGVAAVEPAKPNLRFVPPTDTWKTAWTTGFNLTWPLFDSGKSRAEGAALTAQAEAVDARRRDFEENVAVEIRQRLLDLESGRVALDASSKAWPRQQRLDGSSTSAFVPVSPRTPRCSTRSWHCSKR